MGFFLIHRAFVTNAKIRVTQSPLFTKVYWNTGTIFNKTTSGDFNESKKILHDPSLEIIPTCVRVPVKIGHSESLCISIDRDLSLEDINSCLSNYSGIKILDDGTDLPYPMPLYSEGKDEVFVGRIRKSPNNDREINLWLSCDNLLKGAALNALQILESMIKRDLIKIN